MKKSERVLSFLKSLERCPVSPVLRERKVEIYNSISWHLSSKRRHRISDGEGVEKSDSEEGVCGKLSGSQYAEK